MIQVAVSGACGRMGTLIIQNVLSDENMELVACFDVKNVGDDCHGIKISDPARMEDVLKNSKADVLIDFTLADPSFENIKKAALAKVNLVVGTTGFSKEQHAKMDKIISKNVAAVISPNFSVGVNVFWNLIKEGEKYLKDYDVEIVEVHHRHKKDAPSGTALRAAEAFDRDIVMHSLRCGDIVGDHTVLFAKDGERLEITHRAHSRQAFASGAILAAK